MDKMDKLFKKAGEPLTPSTKEEPSVDDPKREKSMYTAPNQKEKDTVAKELELFIQANFADAFDAASKKEDGAKKTDPRSREEILNNIVEDPKKIHALLDLVLQAFRDGPSLLRINKVPIYICGDIHGQHGDLLQVFEVAGRPWEARFLFLGDYVDRGESSLRVILLLFACRLVYPNNVYILRGNHELVNINKSYGFRTEIYHRFRSSAPGEMDGIYAHFNEVFAYMPLAAHVGKRILCMHGGLSPDMKSLEEINSIPRPLTCVRGIAQDLLWADPDKGVAGFDKNKVRGVSHVFGPEAVKDKCRCLNLDVIIRAHQVVEFGYAVFGLNSNQVGKAREKTDKSVPLKEGALVTVFTAARYHDELMNYSAIVLVKRDLTLSFVQLKPLDFVKLRNETAERQAEAEKDDNNKQ